MAITAAAWQSAVVPLLVGVLWGAVAPLWVRVSHPRLADRNPDHFARLVRFTRMWGLAAALVGFALVWLL